uniref:Secreted protein n=1 Tax=Arundo donax TaxID=35708 RepID=A0A0A9HD33_ARUDO
MSVGHVGPKLLLPIMVLDAVPTGASAGSLADGCMADDSNRSRIPGLPNDCSRVARSQCLLSFVISSLMLSSVASICSFHELKEAATDSSALMRDSFSSMSIEHCSHLRSFSLKRCSSLWSDSSNLLSNSSRMSLMTRSMAPCLRWNRVK